MQPLSRRPLRSGCGSTPRSRKQPGSGEVLPAMRSHGLPAFCSQQGDRRTPGTRGNHPPDGGYPNSCDRTRQPRRWPCSEEQLVVFPAVKHMRQSGPRKERQGSSVHLGSYAGLLAELSQVRREAVAQVDGRRSQTTAAQPKPLRQPRFRKKMRGKLFLLCR